MKVDTFKCDVCGQIKGENNHWFRVDTAGTGLELYAWGVAPSSASTVDLCSDQCVTKTVQQWLTAQAQGQTGGRRYEERRHDDRRHADNRHEDHRSAAVMSIVEQRAS